MKLTLEIAEKNVGKYIDCYRRFFGCYPMKIVNVNGEIMLQDWIGSCMPIPEKDTDFNCQYFDYILTMEDWGGEKDMKLTLDIAKKNVGKYIDRYRYRRILGSYPMKIVNVNGEIMLESRAGFCTPIPEKDTDFNCQYFDYIFTMYDGA